VFSVVSLPPLLHQIDLKLLEIKSKFQFLFLTSGKKGGFIVRKNGHEYRQLLLLNLPGAAILNFMTSDGFPIVSNIKRVAF